MAYEFTRDVALASPEAASYDAASTVPVYHSERPQPEGLMRDLGSIVVLLAFLAPAPHAAHPQVPPGSTRMVEVEGYATRVLELGLEEREDGEPVLVLFAGTGSPLEEWGAWLSEASELAPVVSYDRPGIGRSEYDGLAHSPPHLVEQAHAVLDAVSIPPPYVLVGHSWGGTLALYYAGRYESEVVGIVYLDPFDPRDTRCGIRMISGEECEVAKAEATERLSRLPLSAGRMAELDATRVFLDTPVEDRGLPPDPDVPTGVLLATAGPPNAEPYVDGWMSRRVSRYAEWVRNRPESTLVVATDAVHFVYREVPTLTTEVVRRVLSAVRGP